MKLQFRDVTFQLHSADYKEWLAQWDSARMTLRKGRMVLEGNCCFCDAFRIERRGFCSTCTECPLMAAFGIEGKNRVEGCLVLLEKILGEKGVDSVSSWGLIFSKFGLVVVGNRGRESVEKIRKAIENSVVDWSDQDGETEIFKRKTEGWNDGGESEKGSC